MNPPPPLGIDPSFPDPPRGRDLRSSGDGSLTASPVMERSSLAGPAFFLLFGTFVALFVGTYATAPWWIAWVDLSEHGTFARIVMTLGALGGGFATLYGVLVWLSGSLEFAERVRTVITASIVKPWGLRFVRLSFAMAATSLIFLTVPTGLALLAAIQPDDVESWRINALSLGVGWCTLLTLMLVALCLVELHGAFTVVASLRSGALNVLRQGDGHAYIAHLSDLHLTAGDEVPTIESRSDKPVSGNQPLRQVLTEHWGTFERAHVILITGDMTDAGTSGEWRAFFDIFPQQWLPRTVLVPGNHDLNITNPRNLLWAGEGEEQFGRKLRALRLIAAMDRCQGERTSVLNAAGELVPLRQFLEPIAQELIHFISEPPSRTFEDSGVGLREATPVVDRQRLELPHTLMRAIFPCVVDVPGTALRIVVLDSNIEADTVATNAMGSIRQDHLQKLRRILQMIDDAGEPCVITLHHHVALPRHPGDSLRDRAQVRFMACENARELVATLQGPRDRVIMHGHRHVKYEGSVGGRAHIVSAPSTTLGNEWGPKPTPSIINVGFALVEVTWGARGVTVAGFEECHSAFALDEAKGQPYRGAN